MIEWHRVRELREEVGEEDFREVAELFLEEVDEVVERLKTNPIKDKFESDFHFLKGSALNLGFAAFAAVCADEERRAAKGEHDAINVQASLECYAASRAQFLVQMESSNAA